MRICLNRVKWFLIQIPKLREKKMTRLTDGKSFASTPHDDDAPSRQKFENRRRFFNIKSFVFLSGVLMCAQSALSMYTKGVLTSIERQFQISSSLSGLLVGSFNVGNVLFVVLVSEVYYLCLDLYKWMYRDQRRYYRGVVGPVQLAIVIPHPSKASEPHYDITELLADRHYCMSRPCTGCASFHLPRIKTNGGGWGWINKISRGASKACQVQVADVLRLSFEAWVNREILYYNSNWLWLDIV